MTTTASQGRHALKLQIHKYNDVLKGFENGSELGSTFGTKMTLMQTRDGDDSYRANP